MGLVSAIDAGKLLETQVTRYSQAISMYVNLVHLYCSISEHIYNIEHMCRIYIYKLYRYTYIYICEHIISVNVIQCSIQRFLRVLTTGTA